MTRNKPVPPGYMQTYVTSAFKQHLESLSPTERDNLMRMFGKRLYDYYGIKYDKYPLELYKHFSELADSGIEAFKKIPEFQKVTCKEGCAHCCKLCTVSTLGEALTITQQCALRGIPIDYEHLKTQAVWGEDVDNWYGKPETLRRCVFLAPASHPTAAPDTCLIYAFRPIACRKYYVCSEPALCDLGRRGNVMGVNSPEIELCESVHLTVAMEHSGTLSQMLLKAKEFRT